MLKPVELEIELFCRGMRLDASCFSDRVHRTRAGLGSGLEIIIPSTPKAIWVNVPVVERFAHASPFILSPDTDGFGLVDSRDGAHYRVVLPATPKWYSQQTSSGIEMRRIGVLQGNYLGIYVSNRCLYWSWSPPLDCKFCTTAKNVGVAEESRKRVEDVVEVARAARDESGCIFTHFNTGYHYEDRADREIIHGLRQCEPFVRAVRREVGGFIGVQAVPVLRASYHEYDALIDAGTDHFSFCYEFEDPAVFARICPGKAATVGQKAFFEAMEYTSKKLGKGRVSGEIIAGIESVESTKQGIDRIVNAGAFPTVCIFRPTIGSEMEEAPPPDPNAMKDVFAYLYEACRRSSIPIGILPIEVSLVVQPEEAAALVVPSIGNTLYSWRNRTLRQIARPYVRWKTRPRNAAA
ncbi:MAG TPA: radical SAM protein [Thermoanaerobaculia bacterium]|nr:radical SAM protein [Thermoanaerobaculia bacterium]